MGSRTGDVVEGGVDPEDVRQKGVITLTCIYIGRPRPNKG